MIEKIQIKNFRGIKELEIKDFGKFNIFVGENSCGKTSILEAIAICYGSEKDGFIFRVQDFRHILVLPSNLASFFYNFNFKSPIEITSIFNSKEIQTKISATIDNVIDYAQDEKYFSSDILEKNINGLKFKRKYEKEEYISEFIVQPPQDGGIRLKNQREDRLLSLAVFVPSDIERMGLKYFINTARKEKRHDELVRYLKIFNERVISIETQENNVLINLEGVSKLIDINLLGEGFKKYATILALIIARTQSHQRFCVCIDEIENGLHPSSIKELLEAILKLSEKIDFQFFFTTHSLEFLDISRKILREKSKVFEIASTEEGIKAYPYSQDGEAYYTLDRIDPRG